MDAAVFHEPRRRFIAIDSPAGAGELAALDFGPQERPVDILFLHANSFNALTYRSILSPLSAGLRVLAVDQRGHGLSRLAAEPVERRSWSDLASDAVALIDALDQPAMVVSGHSMGAVVAALAAAQRPAAIKALVLFEPVILPPLVALLARGPLAPLVFGQASIVKTALRRRRLFADRMAALQSYRGRGAFRTWPEAMLADYVVGGLVEVPGGEGVTLACEPEWEASNYAAQGADVRRALHQAGAPTRIFAGSRGSTCHLGAGFLRRNRHVFLTTVDGAGHFLPMERPGLVRDALIDAADGAL